MNVRFSSMILTVLDVAKSTSAEKYQLTVITGSPHFVYVTSDKAEISVLCKYTLDFIKSLR